MYCLEMVWGGPYFTLSLLLLYSKQQVKAVHIQPLPWGCVMTTKNGEQLEQEVAWTDLKVPDVGVGEKDLCWEVSSLKIQPSTQVPSGSHGKLSGLISHCCAEWGKQTQLSQPNRSLSQLTALIKGCLTLLSLLLVSLILPSQFSRQHSHGG